MSKKQQNNNKKLKIKKKFINYNLLYNIMMSNKNISNNFC